MYPNEGAWPHFRYLCVEYVNQLFAKMAASLLGARGRDSLGGAEVHGQDDGRARGNAGAGEGRGQPRGSWAEMLTRNLPTKLKKNVLEIVLEKDERGSFIVSDVDCARVMRKIGIDSRPGVHVEEIQICPNGRGIILITLKKEVPIEQFCRHDVLEVTSSGIRAVNIRPTNKREIVVNIKNIHPNTSDEGVMDYLSKFGKMVTRKVIYGVYGDGPLKGFRNGDRAYKIEMKSNVNLGTYHVLDGQKVNVRYPGQLQTCARCYETARTCKGKGIARRCESENGPRVDFSDYILNLWNEIGYSPENVQLADLNDEADEDNGSNLIQQEGGKFTPAKVQTSDVEKFTGVSIKSFPKETDHCQIIDLLLASGLSADNLNDVQIKPNGTVAVKNVSGSNCSVLIKNLHNKKFFGRKLFCNGVIPLTPEREPAAAVSPPTGAPSSVTSVHPAVTTTGIELSSPSNSPTVTTTAATKEAASPMCPAGSKASPTLVSTVTPTQVYSSPKMSSAISTAASSYLSPPQNATTSSSSSPFPPPNQSLLDIGSGANADFQQYLIDHEEMLTNSDVVRRHSLSLRTPPPGSLAADILQSSSIENQKLSKSILDIKEMANRLSEMESSQSSSDDDIDLVSNEDEEFKTMNERRRYWKQKRKHSTTPSKESFMKKLNRNPTPPLKYKLS